MSGKEVEHEDRDGCLARVIGEMRGEIERLNQELTREKQQKKTLVGELEQTRSLLSETQRELEDVKRIAREERSRVRGLKEQLEHQRATHSSQDE